MDIISVLNYFGITASNITPLVIVGGIGIVIVFKHTKPMRDCVDSIKTNITAITGFLSSTQPTFPSNILKQMSPYQIQPEGEKIINDSGLATILKISENTKKI
jgi:hypothetical protein